MSSGRRTASIVTATLVGVLVFVIVVLWVLSSPDLAPDVCRPGYDRCVASGEIGFLECRLEVYHCRLRGPEHWNEVLDE